MKPTHEEIEAAADQLAILQFWPADPAARGAIMILLSQMVGTKEQLDWLVYVMVNQVGTWHGPKELRGVFCTRFKPLDGIEANCVTSIGFTPADCENENIARIGPADVQRRIGGMVKAKALLQ